jgi:glycosyltransferase involved in cell wall biosynthesis
MRDVRFAVITKAERGLPSSEPYGANCDVVRVGPASIMPRRIHRPFFPQRVIAAELRHRSMVVRASESDVVHVHGPALGMDLLRADGILGRAAFSKILTFRDVGKPKLLTMHGLFSPYSDAKVYREFERALASQFSTIVCVDRSIHAHVSEMAPGASSHYIPNAVDTSLFKGVPSVPGENLKIAYVGRPDPLRGFETVAKLAKTFPQGFELTLVLASEQGASLDFPAAVRVLRDAPAEGVRGELVRSDLVLNPIRIPVISRVTLEAMSCGRTVVAVERPDNHPLVHGETGLLFDGTLPSLLDLLEDVRKGRHDLERIGRNARAAVEREFSYEAVMPRLHDIYERLAKSG